MEDLGSLSLHIFSVLLASDLSSQPSGVFHLPGCNPVPFWRWMFTLRAAPWRKGGGGYPGRDTLSPFASSHFLLQRVHQYGVLPWVLLWVCQSLSWCPLGWDCDADTEGYLFPGAKRLSPHSQLFYMDGEHQNAVGEYLSAQAGPPWGAFRFAGVRGQLLGCREHFTSLPAAHKFLLKSLPLSCHRHSTLHSQARRLK